MRNSLAFPLFLHAERTDERLLARGLKGNRIWGAVLWGIPKRSAGEEQHGMEIGEGAISFQDHQALKEAWKREEISKQE